MGDSPLLAFVKSRHLLIAIAMKDDIEVKLKKKVIKTRKKDKQSDVIERLRVIYSRLEGERIKEIGNSNINLQFDFDVIFHGYGYQQMSRFYKSEQW